MVTDKINQTWLEYTNQLAGDFELFRETDPEFIKRFSNDQLHYLVLFNWGYSGAVIMKETLAAEAELIARNCPYNQELAEEIEALAEEFY